MSVRAIMSDCLDQMAKLDAGSVDLVLTDPPYGTTACAWDVVIPFAPMWSAIGRVLRPGRAAVLMASQPFSSSLIASNPRAFAHGWVWDKGVGANFLQAKRQPLKVHEDVIVFGLNGK